MLRSKTQFLLFLVIAALFGCDNPAEKIETETKATEMVESKIPAGTPVLKYEPKQGENIIKTQFHFLHGLKAKTENGTVNVVVEIPTGTVDKWEVDKTDGVLRWQEENGELRKVKYLGYPGNYGMIPQTYLPKELGGDGDPLDVIVLGPAVGRGAILETKIIGVLELLDRGEQDDKLIAVMEGTPFYGVNNIEELKANFNGTLEIVSTWFSNYKGPGKMELKSIADKNRAEEILEASIKAYKEAN